MIDTAVATATSRSRSRHIVAALLLCMAVIAAPLGNAAEAKAKRTNFELEACSEALGFFFRPPGDLAPFLPEGFAPDEVHPGLGEVMVVMTQCEGGIINGKKVGPTMFSEVAIYVQEPAQAEQLYELDPFARGGHQYYHLWHLTDQPALRKAFAKLGIDGDVVGGASFETSSDVQASADMPWDKVSYSLSSIHPVPTIAYNSRPSTFWHVSSKGLAATPYRSTGDVNKSGVTQVTTPADGALAEVTGSATGVADGSSFVTYEKLTGTTYLFKK